MIPVGPLLDIFHRPGEKQNIIAVFPPDSAFRAKTTTAVFIVSPVVPAALVHRPGSPLHDASLTSFPRRRANSANIPCAYYQGYKMAWKDRCWPGILSVFGVHLTVVTRGPLVLDCLLQITHIIPTGSEIIH